ncbi:hypothetical protein OH77DRAFT_1451441 [Trametes cingulata]|nr:hypothetical protein OH77DRAFT_1451441 [Trametes cingulata]
MNASATAIAVPAPPSIPQAPTIAFASAASKPKAKSSASASSSASTSSRGDASTKGKKASQGDVTGWAEFVKSERVCSVGSCAKVLAAGWRWKRCPECKAAGAKRTMTASCTSCSMAFTMRMSAATSGTPPQCSACRSNPVVSNAGIMLPEPPPRSVMGPPPPKQCKRKLVVPEDPHRPKSILEQVMPFVHPDHRHLLQPQSGGFTPDQGMNPVQRLAALYPSIQFAPVGAPHYGPRGEILTVGAQHHHAAGQAQSRPRKRVVAESFVPPQSGRTPEESIVVSDSSDATRSEQGVAEKKRKVNVAHTNGGTVNFKISPQPNVASTSQPHSTQTSSGSLTPHDSTPLRKRQRVLAPAAPLSAPTERICAARGCGRQIAPRTQGDMCADCGFLLWRKQFRARVAGLSASVSSSSADGPAAERPGGALERGVASSGSAPILGWSARPAERSSEQAGSSSVGFSLANRGAGTVAEEPMDCSEDDEPLAVVVARRRRSATSGSRTASVLPTPTPGMRSPSPVVRKPPAVAPPDIAQSPVNASREPERQPAPAPAASSVGSLEPTSSAPPQSVSPAPGIPTHPPPAESPELPTEAVQTPVSSDETAKPKPSAPLRILLPPRAASSPSSADAPRSPTASPEEPGVPPAFQPRRIRLIVRPPAPPPSLASDFEDQSCDSEEEDFSSVAPSPSSSRSSSPSPLYTPKLSMKEIERMASLAWDSDESELTPIEDLTDMGESEVDSSEESEDEIPLAARSVDDATPSLRAASQAPWPPPPRPLKHRGICGVVRCMNLLVHGTRMRFCSICQSRKRTLQQQHQIAGAVVQDEVEDEEMVIKMPPDGDTTGYRKCNKKSCKQLIPPETDYSYRRCPRCRVDARNRARRLRAKPLAISDDDDEELFANMSRQATRTQNFAPATTVQTPTAAVPPKDKPLPVVPAYQHFAALLDAFRARFSEFTVAQVHYLRFKSQQEDGSVDKAKPHRNPIVFRFDGEYSVVADPSGGLVDAVVHCVLRNVQAALGLHFTPVGVNPGPESSVIAVLRCVYGAQVPLHPSKSMSKFPTEQSPPEGEGAPPKAECKTDTLTVRMVGELQICVAWDRRHRFFPGQRILVRFRLVG